MRAEVSARFLHRALTVAERSGLDPSALLDRVWAWPRPLPDPAERVSQALLCDVLERIAPDLPDVGLRIAELVEPANMDLATALASASATVRAGILASLRYEVLWTSVPVHRAEEVEGGMRVVVTWPESLPDRPARPICHEWSVWEMVRGTRMLLGDAFAPREVSFAHAPSSTEAVLRSQLACPVRFEAHETSITLTNEQLDTPLPGRNEMIATYLERQAAEASSGLASELPMSERVRRIARRDLGSREIRSVSAATELARSTRQLQRDLASEGTTFAALVDDTRRELAMDLLAQGLPIASVSERTGFSEPRAFYRAFRRWTGATPDTWRDG